VPPNDANFNLVDYKLWGSYNSGSIRRRSRMCMNSRSDWLKSGLVCSRTLLTLLSMHEETVCVLVFARRADTLNIDCSSWTTGHLDKLSARVKKCKPNVIYACYFNKVIILPCIKCNISLVLTSPGSVKTDVGCGGKLNSHLMASCFRNICAKNRPNPLILFKVTIDNVGGPFWDTV